MNIRPDPPGDIPMKIAVWPDGTWCDALDVERHQREAGLGDDYAIYSADSDEHADAIAIRVQRTGCPDGIQRRR